MNTFTHFTYINYLAEELPSSRGQLTEGEVQSLQCGCAEPCKFPKCEILCLKYKKKVDNLQMKNERNFADETFQLMRNM